MSTILINLLILLISYVCVEQSLGLFNGIKITNGQFSSHVMISLPNGKQCGGTIINSNHILTASSCVFNTNNELIGSDDLTISAKWNITDGIILPQITNATVAAIYAHPQYSPYSKENDIAVLKLSTKLQMEPDNLNPDIAIANLNLRIVADKVSCSLCGFIKNNTKDGLMYIKLPIVNRIECNTISQYAFQIQDGMICATGTRDFAVCEEDIGSGLYCNGNLSGILSFGAGCDIGYPAVYTQVRMYTQWIRKQLWRNDIPRAGPTSPPSNRSSYIGGQKKCITFVLTVFAIIFLFHGI